MKKLVELKKIFKIYKLDGYIIPKNDEYFNEYVSKNNDRLKFITDFSGSAGFAIILKNQNYLFVDGRYTIQAQIQSGKSFKIITIPHKFPKDVLKNKKKLKIGFDPKLHNSKQVSFLFNIKNIVLEPVNENLIDIIWSNRPKDLVKPFFSISKKNSGQGSKEKIMEYVNKAKDKDDPFRLFGFGHRVYKNYDPRASVMRKTCHEVLDLLGVKNEPLLDIAMELEKIALKDEYFIEKKLYPNVDFYSGIILKAMGFPTDMFTVLFAVARTVGWVAQWNEMITDPVQRIGRPRQLYTGKVTRKFVPLEKR